MSGARNHRSWEAQLRYLWALVRRFRATFVSLFVLVVGGGALLFVLYDRAGLALSFPRALVVAYFLLFAQTIVDVPENGPIALLFVLIPPLGIVTVAEGLVRFAYLFFAKQRDDKEWFAVLAQTLKGHVIVCGAGRVGYRLFEQFKKLGIPMVIIERDENAPFVSAIRAEGVALLIEDVRSPKALEQANIREARAIVCATDDDLANLNIALDARRLKPSIRVVMRLFDDDLVAKTRVAFDVEAFSTSALAAPVMAVAALDPSIKNSFEVGGRLMVVAELTASRALIGRNVADLRDVSSALVIHLVRSGGETLFDPPGATLLGLGDTVTVQATMQAYQSLCEELKRAEHEG